MTALMPAFVASVTEDNHISGRTVSTKAVLTECSVFSTTVGLSFYLRQSSRLRN